MLVVHRIRLSFLRVQSTLRFCKASILSSRLSHLPQGALLAPAAAQEKLAGGPSGMPPLMRVGGLKKNAVAMANGAARRSISVWSARRPAAKKSRAALH